MSARDVIHDSIKNALLNDGWSVTHDPLTVEYEELRGFVDLGAERVVAAEKGNEKIAVEIKSFIGKSVLFEIEKTLGQYLLYRTILKQTEPDRHIYVGIGEHVYKAVFQRKGTQLLTQEYGVDFVVVNIESEEIVTWIRN